MPQRALPIGGRLEELLLPASVRAGRRGGQLAAVPSLESAQGADSDVARGQVQGRQRQRQRGRPAALLRTTPACPRRRPLVRRRGSLPPGGLLEGRLGRLASVQCCQWMLFRRILDCLSPLKVFRLEVRRRLQQPGI